MPNPYLSPKAQEKPFPDEKIVLWKRVRTLSIILIIASPLLGGVGTVIRMTNAFRLLAETGQGEPAELADSISFALLTTMWGLIISILAIIPLLVALKRLRFYRKSNLSLSSKNY